MAKQPKTKGTREGAVKVISELKLKASEIKFTAETKADYYKRLLEDMDSARFAAARSRMTDEDQLLLLQVWVDNYGPTFCCGEELDALLRVIRDKDVKFVKEFIDFLVDGVQR